MAHVEDKTADYLSQHQRGQIGIWHIAVIGGIFFASKFVSSHSVLIKSPRFLQNVRTAFQNFRLTINFAS